jgi:hypothetical protein
MAAYWALRTFTKFGSIIALIVAIAIPTASVAAMMSSSWSWMWFMATTGAGLLAGFLIKVFSELARVIVEMLLPV